MAQSIHVLSISDLYQKIGGTPKHVSNDCTRRLDPVPQITVVLYSPDGKIGHWEFVCHPRIGSTTRCLYAGCESPLLIGHEALFVPAKVQTVVSEDLQRGSI